MSISQFRDTTNSILSDLSITTVVLYLRKIVPIFSLIINAREETRTNIEKIASTSSFKLLVDWHEAKDNKEKNERKQNSNS